jgi:hypothetical protein
LCDPGWYSQNTDDCSAYVLHTAIDGDTNECEGVPLLLPLMPLMPGRQSLSCSENRTSWRSRSFLNVSLSVAPTAPVRCQLSSSDVTVATPDLLSVSFSPGDLTSKEVRLVGTVDAVKDGEQSFDVQVVCEGADRRISTARASSRGNNKDVPFPQLSSIFPSTVPFVGTQITLVGANFLAYNTSIEVLVGGVKVNGERVVRTVLVNETRNELLQISFDSGAGAEWERKLSALVTPAMRRAGGGGGCKVAVGMSRASQGDSGDDRSDEDASRQVRIHLHRVCAWRRLRLR